MNTFIQSVNHFQCAIRITAFCFKVGCQSFKRIQHSQRIWHWFVTFRNFRTYAFSIIIFVKILIIRFYTTCDARVSQFYITLCTVVEADKFVKCIYISSLECKTLYIVINLIVLWSTCLSSSFVHFRNGSEYLTSGFT